MPKGIVDSGGASPETRVKKLRDDLSTIEIAIADLGRGHADVLQVLRLRDTIEDDVAALREAGVDFRPEQTRLDTVDNILSRRAARIARALQIASPAAEARRLEKPSEEKWWWHLDAIWAGRIRKQVIRYGLIVAAVVVVLLGANYVIDRFFGMSPLEKEAYSHTALGEQYLYSGRYDEAATEYEQAVAINPKALSPHIALAVLYEKLGRPADSEVALVKARALAPEVTIALELARSYTIVGDLESALEQADRALALDAESVEAYLARATIYEGQREREKAIADLEKAAALAEAQGLTTLQVVARYRMGMLLQDASGISPGRLGP